MISGLTKAQKLALQNLEKCPSLIIHARVAKNLKKMGLVEINNGIKLKKGKMCRSTQLNLEQAIAKGGKP